MKRHISNIFVGFAAFSMVASLSGCSAETPFEDDGVGTVYLRPIVNSITTRAEDNAADAEYDYSANGKIYISRLDGSEGQNGIVYKHVGFSSIDPVLTLHAGKYSAEAWSGVSVPASFTQKYYRCYQEFQVTKGEKENVVLDCKIQNVVVSINVNDQALQEVLKKTKDFKVTVTNNSQTNGSLDFTLDNIADARGYFMMAEGDTDLQYTISGEKSDGKPIAANQRKIENVKSGHHYILKFTYKDEQTDDNPVGSFDTSAITVTVEDEDPADTEEQDRPLFPTEPTITGIGFDLNQTQVFAQDSDIPEDLAVMLCTIGKDDAHGFAEVSISSSDIPALQSDINFNVEANSTTANGGIEWLAPDYDGDKNVSTAFILFKKSFIQSLSSGSITIYVKDIAGKSSSVTLTISRTSQPAPDLD